MAQARPTRGRVGGRVRTLLAVVGLCLVCVVAAELAARAAIGVARGVGWDIGEERADLPAFDHVDYDARAVFREMEAAEGFRYSPYEIWRHAPADGPLFTVDEDGFRVTRFNSDDPDALEIWMLGGSAVFGYAVPDDETLPSHLARLLNERGVPARVRNLGEHGYVSTQELIRLHRQLQLGGRPDLVIFYDGYNDWVAAATNVDYPGVHFRLGGVAERYETPLLAAVRETGLYTVVQELRWRFWPDGAGDDAGPVADVVARRGAEAWLANARAARALARELGIEIQFYLQPSVLLGTKPLHPSEERLKRPYPAYAAMYETILAGAAEMDLPVVDLTEVFADVGMPLYVDGVHVTGPGNGIAAQRIAESLRRRICVEGSHASGVRSPESLAARLCSGSHRQ